MPLLGNNGDGGVNDLFTADAANVDARGLHSGSLGRIRLNDLSID